jgi:GT2 family glycosyltransferase
MHGSPLSASGLTTARPSGPVSAPPRLQTPSVDVGVIYTGEDALVSRLVQSLDDSRDAEVCRLLLVDNASTGGTDQFEPRSPTTVIRNQRRLGYAANANRILQASVAPFILILNTDLYFDPGERCISKMLEFMRQNPDCGLAGCCNYRADGEFGYPARRFQTLRTIACRRLGLAKLARREIDGYLYRDRGQHSSYDCDWLSGCFLMIRRKSFEDVGPFDCEFRKYFEDVDYGLRMARAGWRVMFNGGTFCYHDEQRASRSLFSKDAALHLASYARWVRKWGFNPRRHLPADLKSRRRAAHRSQVLQFVAGAGFPEELDEGLHAASL